MRPVPEPSLALPPEHVYVCPICGREVFDTVYIFVNQTVAGCDRCLQGCAPEEVLV